MKGIIASRTEKSPAPRAGVAPGRWWWLVVSLLILFVTPAAARSPQPQVLILNSYHQGYAWSDEELAGVLDRLHQGYPGIEPSIEYLDAKRFPGPDQVERLRAYLAAKYRGRKIDLVIALDNCALDMARRYRQEIFPGVPLVFCGINGFTPALLKGQEKMTGLAEVEDAAGTLEAALRLQPRAKDVLVIHDYTATGRAVRQEIEALVPVFAGRVKISFTPPETFQEVLDQLKALPPGSLGIITGFATDSRGESLGMEESTSLLASAGVPLYAMHKVRLGHGIVGGILLGGREHGRKAGEMAQKILAGEDPSRLPVVTQSTASPMFDYLQLTRFKLPLAALPAGSIIINQPVSFYARYKSLTLAVSWIIAFLILTVAILTMTIIRLLRTQARLRESEEKYRFLVEKIPAVVFTGYGDWSVNFFDRKIEALTGYSKEEFDSRKLKWSDLILPEDFGEAPRAFIEALKTTKSYVREYRIRKKDGEISWIQALGGIFCDDAGKVDHVSGVFFDITERKEAEEALQESQRKLLSIFRAAPVGIGLVINRVIQEANETLCRMTGYTRATGGTDARLLYPTDEDYEYVGREKYRQMGESGIGTVETRWQRQDGKIIHIILSSTPMDASDLTKGVTFTALDITARKLAEEALRESETLFRSLVENITLGITLISSDYRIKMTNAAQGDLFRKSPSTFIGKECFREFEKRPAVCAHCPGTIAMATGQKAAVETEGVRDDGSLLAARLHAFPSFGPDGEITGFIEVVEDISDRKRAEEALARNYRELQETAQRLEQSRNMLQLIIESVPVRVFWKDSDLRFMGCNTLFARDAGLSHPEQLLGKDDFAMGWREQADLYRTDDRQVMESRRPKINMVEPQTTPAGATIWLNTSKVPLQMPDGEVFGVLGVYEDITERKLAEEELHDTRERLELALKGADMGSWDWNVQAGAVIYNQRWAEMLGYNLEEIKPFFSSWEQLIHPDDLPRFMEALNTHLEGKTPFYESEHRLRHKSGEWLWVLDKGKVIERDAQGQPLRACGTQLDITGRKQAEAEQLRFSKLESLAILAGGIAHDFNNILTAIIGNLSLAMLDIHKKEHLRERLNEAERACLQAQTLSRQLLTFAKGGAPIKELVAVEKLLIDSGSLASSGLKARCEFSFGEDLWAAEADPGQISQVFQNLIINAIQAMPTGGTIKVRGENLVVEAKSDLPLSPGRYVKISIQDQGVGIPADFLLKIFDPYFTTKQTGSGLGLATAYSIVKNHHGHISVESELGAGTIFHVYLPRLTERWWSQPEKAGRVLAGLGKILVMDDEEMVRHILDKMLGHLGYKAKVARDGEEAIELFTAAQASGKPFDAVILDLTVPGGLGGRETMARLLKIDPRIKAIVSSGYSDDPIMADFREYGFSGVIAKPYRISELSKILQEVLAPGDNRTSDNKG